MRKIQPKGKLYAATPVFELDVSYNFKGQHYKNNYLFESAGELEEFAREALTTFLKKNFQNIHISMYRKEKYTDTKINESDVQQTVKSAGKDRSKRLEGMY